MSFLDNYSPSSEFAFPGDMEPLRTDLSAGEKSAFTLKKVPFTLLDIRAKRGLGADGSRTVINIRARAQADNYKQTGEVAFWFSPADFDPKTARGGDTGAKIAREQAAMLARLMVDSGISAAEDWDLGDNPDGETILNKLVAAVNNGVLRGTVTFTASLHWENRAYTTRDGELRVHQGSAEMRYISNVKKSGDDADMPF